MATQEVIKRLVDSGGCILACALGLLPGCPQGVLPCFRSCPPLTQLSSCGEFDDSRLATWIVKLSCFPSADRSHNVGRFDPGASGQCRYCGFWCESHARHDVPDHANWTIYDVSERRGRNVVR
jgi:hypothetical protein